MHLHLAEPVGSALSMLKAGEASNFTFSLGVSAASRFVCAVSCVSCMGLCSVPTRAWISSQVSSQMFGACDNDFRRFLVPPSWPNVDGARPREGRALLSAE